VGAHEGALFPEPLALAVAAPGRPSAGVWCSDRARVVIRARVNITFPWRLEIGDHSWIGEEVIILNLAPVRIGLHCCLSQRAFLCTGSHDFHAAAFNLITAPITIADRSWIAATCFVAPGVTVGPDAMTAAGSVVTRDVAPFTIVAGNPRPSPPRLPRRFYPA